MKVCIYGAGCIGGLLANSIQRGDGGHEVSVVARGPHLEAIKNNGLTVRTAERTTTTRHQASDKPSDLGPQDLVVVATKTPALPDVAHSIGPLLKPDTLVAFTQNGVPWFYGDGFRPGGMAPAVRRLDPDGILHSAIGPERSLGLIAISGGEIIEPGVIEASRVRARSICGAAMAEMAVRAKRMIEDLRVVDMDIAWADDIRRAMWLKTFNVIGNFGTTALTGAAIGEVQADPAALEVRLNLVAETHAVATAHGFKDLGFDKDKARANPSRSMHKPSILQDLERGRPMEIDSSYLVVQDLARQAGVPTPTIDVVAALLKLRAKVAGCYP
jgi:2-dehydropantoate 2-reductase